MVLHILLYSTFEQMIMCVTQIHSLFFPVLRYDFKPFTCLENYSSHPIILTQIPQQYTDCEPILIILLDTSQYPEHLSFLSDHIILLISSVVVCSSFVHGNSRRNALFFLVTITIYHPFYHCRWELAESIAELLQKMCNSLRIIDSP
jgi:hypothetical protein